MFVGLILFSRANKSRASSAKARLDRMHKLIESTHEIMNNNPISIDRLENMQKAQEKFDSTMDGLKRENINHPSFEEYKAKKKAFNAKTKE